jgi:hypothetical protein
VLRVAPVGERNHGDAAVRNGAGLADSSHPVRQALYKADDHMTGGTAYCTL